MWIAADGCAEPGAQNTDPEEQEPEVVARCGEDRVCDVAVVPGEMIATHAILVLAMTDDAFDSGSAPESAL